MTGIPGSPVAPPAADGSRRWWVPAATDRDDDPQVFPREGPTTDMVDRIAEARRAVDAASEAVDERTIREQLQSVDRGLAAVDEGPTDDQEGERLEEVEAKLAGLGDEVDGAVADRIGDARDQIDAFRRERTREWE